VVVFAFFSFLLLLDPEGRGTLMSFGCAVAAVCCLVALIVRAVL
jgi:hypothetical protein